MQDLHKIYPHTPVQENALEELREYYFSIHNSLYRNGLIAKAIGFSFGAFAVFYNVVSFQKHMETNVGITSLVISTVALLLASVIAWIFVMFTANILLNRFSSKENYEQMADEFKKRLTKVSEQYVGKAKHGDQIQLHVNGEFIEGGFMGLQELRHPVLTVTILRHEKIGNSYKDTGPLHLSFQDKQVQLWAGIVRKNSKGKKASV